MEHWRNDTDRVKPKHLEKSLYRCHCAPHIKHGLARKQDQARNLRLNPSAMAWPDIVESLVKNVESSTTLLLEHTHTRATHAGTANDQYIPPPWLSQQNHWTPKPPPFSPSNRSCSLCKFYVEVRCFCGKQCKERSWWLMIVIHSLPT
jgi:hypothetical protein